MRLKSASASASLVVLAAMVAGVGVNAAEPATAATAQASARGVTTAYRRLTESQYRNAIRDAFGPAVAINARFEPERREEGLQAVGAARLSITTAGLEQYYSVARSIADQVVDGKDRDAVIGCNSGAPCAEAFLKKTATRLFRRPATADEVQRFTAVFNQGAAEYGDFHKGLKLAVVGVLMSPDFLFRVERAEADPANPGALRLDGYTKAARLSYLVWNTGPDAELLEAARTGDIHTQAGLARHADRLLASPRFEDGVRAFFTDMLEFEAFDTLSKDSATYPKFSQAVSDSAKEETLRFLVDHLVAMKGDYRDIFTSRTTQIDRTLAYVYNVPFLSDQKWAPYTFSEESERSGLLTQATFMSLFAHPAASSPTIRGVKLQEIFRCIQIPQPPADVDFSKVQALEHGTVRVRLVDHMTNPGCAGCHRISDPIGLALERFDGLGQHRTLENGQLIDVSAEIGSAKFNGAQGLGRYLHGDKQVRTCLVKKAHYYGVGRPSDPADREYLTRLESSFASGGYKMPVLFRAMLTDPQFYRVVAPAGVPSDARTASISVSSQPIFGDAR